MLSKHVPVIEIREATVKDIPQIQTIELAAFEVNSPVEVFKQIFEEARGKIFLAIEDSEIVAFQSVLFKNFNEAPIQKFLKNHAQGFFNDDIHPITVGEELYLHLLVVKPERQGRGIAKKLLNFVYTKYKAKYKTITSIIRANNLASLKAVMHTTEAVITGFQYRNPNPQYIGSTETNLELKTLQKKAYNFDSHRVTLEICNGEEEDLDTTQGKIIISRLHELFNAGFYCTEISAPSQASSAIFHFQKVIL